MTERNLFLMLVWTACITALMSSLLTFFVLRSELRPSCPACPTNIIDDCRFLQEAGKRFNAVRQYIPGEYNCANYSQDFQTAMSYFGMDVQYTRGHNMTNGHAWNTVCLAWEPNGARFVDYTEKYPIAYSE